MDGISLVSLVSYEGSVRKQGDMLVESAGNNIG